MRGNIRFDFFFTSFNHNVYILIVTRLFKLSQSQLQCRHSHWCRLLLRIVSGNIKRGNSGKVAVEAILSWVLNGTYEFKIKTSARVSLPSTHVLKLYVQRVILITTTVFKSFGKKKVVTIYDYSKHVYFNGHKYKTPVPPWKEHCEIVPDSYCLCESCFYSSMQFLKQYRVTLHEYGSILKIQESKRTIK